MIVGLVTTARAAGQCPPIHGETKKAPDVPGLSRKHLPSRDQGALDAPIVIPRHKSGKARLTFEVPESGIEPTGGR